MTDQLEELLTGIANQVDEQCNSSDYQAQPDEHLKLVKLHGLFIEKHEFRVGDLVEWKPGFKNKNTPNKKVLIVTKVCENPITDKTENTGSAYFCEQLDIVCAELREGSFVEFYFDSRRFQPFELERKDND